MVSYAHEGIVKLAKALKKSQDRHSECGGHEGCKPGARLEHGTHSMYYVSVLAHDGLIRVTPLTGTGKRRPAKECEIAWMQKSRRWYPI